MLPKFWWKIILKQEFHIQPNINQMGGRIEVLHFETWKIVSIYFPPTFSKLLEDGIYQTRKQTKNEEALQVK